MFAALGGLVAGAGLVFSTPGDTPLSYLTALAAAALLVALAAVALRRRHPARQALGPLAGARRVTAAGTTASRACDPDAPGRPRPRAPSAKPAA